MALSNKAKAYIRKNREQKSAREMAAVLKVSQSDVKDYLSELQKQEKSTDNVEPVPPARKRLFTAITVLIPVLFFVLFEASLRIADYRGNTSLFQTLEEDDGYYTITNPRFASRYFFYTSVVPNPPLELFRTVKPEDGYRVFVMGESSAAGYPYGFNGVPGRVVQDVLNDIMPDRTVEVITVATSAINSYTLYDQVREILQQQPDAIMIYTGHNEYYGALGVGSNENLGSFPGFVRFYLRLQRYKTFLFIRDRITGVSKWFAQRSQGDGPQPPTGTLMQQVVRDQSIPLDSPVYEMGKHQFTSNMSRIVDAFGRAGVPVYIGSLASNLRDHPPFESVETELHPRADMIFEQAGTALASGDVREALRSFTYARDLDALRFRAPSSFNDIIRDLAESRTHVHYVPVKENLSYIAEHGIIGQDLMLEHLHPNALGYFELGWSFAQVMKQTGFGNYEADLNRLRGKQDYFEAMHLTDFDHYLVDHRLRVLLNNWPFVDEPRRDIYRGFVYRSTSDSLAWLVAGNQLRWDEAKVQLGEYYLNTGRADAMLAEFRGLMRDQPYNDSPFLIAAQTLLDRGRLEEAYPYLSQAHRLSPSAFSYKMLGAIEINRGRFAEGAELIETALEMQPNDPQAIFNLSGAYAQMGDIERAMELVRDLENMTPNFPGLQQWRAQLEQILARQQSR